MRAFAVNWTRPYAMRCPGQPYAAPDFELFTTVLSALLWRKHNGSICMITDRTGERFYRSLGLSSLWDGGLRRELDDIPDTVDPLTFWAAGKLFALDRVPAPCVMLDTDFLVWTDIRDRLRGSALTVIHREELNDVVYPDPAVFALDSRYTFPSDWDWRQQPCNTALCCFGSEELRQRYLAQAFAFMGAVRGRDGLIYMVFAEQRLLAMCAASMGISIQALSTQEALFRREQRDFTHVWGFKQAMQAQPALREEFCRRCARRIAREFPAYAPICAAIPALERYFKELPV